MHRYNEEDLFKESTMTFGEHLEELRVCLFKAILGLAVGVILGMVAGFWVVDWIQVPLRNALTRYYEGQAVKNVTGELDDLRKKGFSLPADVKTIKEFVAKNEYSFEMVYVNPSDLARQMREIESGHASLPAAASAEEGEGLTKDSLKPLLIWRKMANDPRAQIKSFNAQEPFMIYLKASLVVGLVLSSPWVFYQIWNFVAAGLFPHERRYVHIFLPVSLALFLLGVGLAFFFVFEPVLNFLFSFNAMLGIDPDPRISEWMGFVLLLPLGFGVSFQLPLVMLFMERVGIFTVKSYLSSWRMAILAIFVLAMILTPSGDPYSMCLMAAPLTVLYFGGILLCRYMPRRGGAFAD
jgi:sec-independent protein translocase protein TatC